MVSTNIGGEPILILGLSQVKILKTMLDTAETSDQNTVMKCIVNFLNDPQCIRWEQDHVD